MVNIENIEALASLAEGVCIVRAVDMLPKGHVRLETRFQYPDRSSIDLFIQNRMQTGGKLVLSDLGQTTLWLNDILVRPWQSKKRARFVEDALHVLGVRQNGGALEADFQMAPESLMDAAVRLGQACVRVADLTFTRRSTLQVYAGEEIEEILSDAELPYEPNAQLAGRNGVLVSVDFLVQGRRQHSAVLTLLSETPGSAHTAANEVFRKMYDLKIPDRIEQRVSVYNDRIDIYRAEDLDRLRDVSDVIGISHREEIQALLAA